MDVVLWVRESKLWLRWYRGVDGVIAGAMNSPERR